MLSERESEKVQQQCCIMITFLSSDSSKVDLSKIKDEW